MPRHNRKLYAVLRITFLNTVRIDVIPAASAQEAATPSQDAGHFGTVWELGALRAELDRLEAIAAAPRRTGRPPGISTPKRRRDQTGAATL